MIGTTEAATLLGVSARRVRVLCDQGRIPGAKLVGKTWTLPNSPVVNQADIIRPSKIKMKSKRKKNLRKL
jgi:excisionase family DNA binding protein